MKECHICKELKNIDLFPKDKDKKDGHRSECKICRSIKNKKYYANNIDKYRERSNKYKETYKEILKTKAREYRKSNLEKGLFKNAYYRALKGGLEFNIALEDITIPDICPVLNIPIYRRGASVCKNSPTLDRIDPNKGYVKGNIAVISHKANSLKSNGTAEEHRQIADFIDKNKKDK